jgi:hypothetical protein
MNSERIDANTETPFRPPQIDIPQGVKLAAAPSLDQIRERFEAVRTNLMAGFDALTAQSQDFRSYPASRGAPAKQSRPEAQ